MNLDHLAQLATEATPGPWRNGVVTIGKIGAISAGCDDNIVAVMDSDYDSVGADAAFIAAANPSVVLALVEVCRAAQEVGDSNFRKLLELLGREGHDEAALRVLNFRKALAKLDNLGGTDE